MSVAAASHTQRTSSNLFFPGASTARTWDVAVQRDSSSAVAGRTEAELALVCAERTAKMDTTEETESALQQSLETMQAGTGTRDAGTLVPDEYAERLLNLFRNEGLRFPSRIRNQKLTVFQPLTISTALRTLNNPRYAGTYFYGRRHYRRTDSDVTV